ncbi:MAG TPA: hypothetical protein V6C95_04040 [Coleofasciculaceae cyanobacterium]
MPSPKQVPAYLRYFKARLKPFRRPAFWLSSAALSLVLFITWQYWNHPEWFSSQGNQQLANSDDLDASPALSSQELAARFADIDSSSVLLDLFDPTSVASLGSLSDGDSQESDKSQKPRSFLTTQKPVVDSSQNSTPNSTNLVASGASVQKPNSINNFAASVQELLNLGPLPGGNRLVSTQTTASTAGANPDPILSLNLLNAVSNNGVSGVSGRTVSDSTNSSTATTAPNTTTSIASPLQLQAQNLPTSSYQSPINYPPASASGISTYNAAGQMNYPAAAPGMSTYNAAGQINYPPVTAPSNSYNYSVPSQPINRVPAPVPVVPSNVGQYSNPSFGQTNSVPNAGYNPVPAPPGIEPSQLNDPQFSTPR